MQVGRQARLRAQITLHSSSPFVAHEVNEGRRAARMRLLLFTRQRETLLAVLLRPLSSFLYASPRALSHASYVCACPRPPLVYSMYCARACVLIVAARRTLYD